MVSYEHGQLTPNGPSLTQHKKSYVTVAMVEAADVLPRSVLSLMWVSSPYMCVQNTAPYILVPTE